MKVHDFIVQEFCKVFPCGVFDLASNTGWASVGVDDDTAEFAVETFRRWWQQMGRCTYLDTKRRLITGDGGGFNVFLRENAEGVGVEIAVALLVVEGGRGVSSGNEVADDGSRHSGGGGLTANRWHSFLRDKRGLRLRPVGGEMEAADVVSEAAHLDGEVRGRSLSGDNAGGSEHSGGHGSLSVVIDSVRKGRSMASRAGEFWTAMSVGGKRKSGSDFVNYMTFSWMACSCNSRFVNCTTFFVDAM